MIKTMETLRRELANMKASMFPSLAQIEKTLDAALAVLVAQQQEINQLKERAGQNHGN